MNVKLMQLRQRREHLIGQADLQRMALAQAIVPMRAPFALADRGLAVLRFIKSHPAWMAGGGILLGTLRPGRVSKWLRRGWLAWQLIRKMRGR